MNKCITKVFRKMFCESNTLQVKQANTIKNLQIINPNISKLSPIEIKEIENTGASFVLPVSVEQNLVESGITQQFLTSKNMPNSSNTSFMFKYIQKMNLLFDYSEVFRDFFQSIAKDDFNYLNLVAEPFFANHIESQLKKIRHQGFHLELENLRTTFDFAIVDFKLYKNFRINRYKNFEKGDFHEVKSYCNGKFELAKWKEDSSFFDNTKPFILATTMKVTSPMKLSIFNQNLSLKLYGKETNQNVDYLVRFETELSLRELFWVLPNPNKGYRTRQTKITDFNEILSGNSFLNEQINKEILSKRSKI